MNWDDEDWIRWRATMTVEHEEVKKGVANFKEFQKRGSRFFDMWESDRSRRRRNLAIALPFILAAVSAVGWGIKSGASMVYEILQIEQEWKKAHPAEFIPQKSVFSQSDPQQARNQQDAKRW